MLINTSQLHDHVGDSISIQGRLPSCSTLVIDDITLGDGYCPYEQHYRHVHTKYISPSSIIAARH